MEQEPITDATRIGYGRALVWLLYPVTAIHGLWHVYAGTDSSLREALRDLWELPGRGPGFEPLRWGPIVLLVVALLGRKYTLVLALGPVAIFTYCWTARALSDFGQA